jgi:hypothetical protein
MHLQGCGVPDLIRLQSEQSTRWKLKNCNFRIFSSPVQKEKVGCPTNTDEPIKIKTEVGAAWLALRLRSRGTKTVELWRYFTRCAENASKHTLLSHVDDVLLILGDTIVRATTMVWNFIRSAMTNQHFC